VVLNQNQFSGNTPGFVTLCWRQTTGWGSFVYASGNTQIYDGKWHHLAGSLRMTDVNSLWLDGVPLTIGTTNQFSAFQSWSITPGLGIGADINSSGTANTFFNGSLDDVRIYNRILSSSEIAQLYSLGTSKLGVTKTPTGLQSGLVGHWTFDGKDMPNGRVNDVSGQGNHGNTVSIATSTFYATGKIGQGLQFDGVNDYVSLPSLTFGTVASFSFWMKVPVNNGAGTVFRFGSIMHCRVGANNVETMGCYADGGSGGAANTVGIRTGTWKHVVYVIDTSNTQRVYVDTVLNSTATETSGSGSTVGAIGSTGSGTWFNGVVDDVRVYNRVLSTAEITELYNMGK
jgi:hypothetical protein